MPQLEEPSNKVYVEVVEKFNPASYYEQAAGRLVIDPQYVTQSQS
jgi:hypothetical protein